MRHIVYDGVPAAVFVPILIRYLWMGIAALWLGTAVFTRTTVRTQSSASRLAYLAFTFPGCLLLAGNWFDKSWLGTPFLRNSDVMAIAGLTITIAGILFAAWARVQLGLNWSGRASVKEGHELITSGPYAIVRHPIYTGILIAAAGNAFAIDRWRCLLGVIFLIIGFLTKIPQEEHLMMEAFPEAYSRYRQKTKALLPGII